MGRSSRGPPWFDFLPTSDILLSFHSSRGSLPLTPRQHLPRCTTFAHHLFSPPASALTPPSTPRTAVPSTDVRDCEDPPSRYFHRSRDKLNLPRRRLTSPTAAALLTTRSPTCGFHPSLRPLQPVPSAPPTPSPLCPTTVVGATALRLLSPNQYNKVAIHVLAGLVCGQSCTVEQYWAAQTTGHRMPHPAAALRHQYNRVPTAVRFTRLLGPICTPSFIFYGGRIFYAWGRFARRRSYSTGGRIFYADIL